MITGSVFMSQSVLWLPYESVRLRERVRVRCVARPSQSESQPWRNASTPYLHKVAFLLVASGGKRVVAVLNGTDTGGGRFRWVVEHGRAGSARLARQQRGLKVHCGVHGSVRRLYLSRYKFVGSNKSCGEYRGL
jgi:hypothetical protein